MSVTVSIHRIVSLPLCNPNRGMDGLPKTMYYGGVCARGFPASASRRRFVTSSIPAPSGSTPLSVRRWSHRSVSLQLSSKRGSANPRPLPRRTP